jgi:predicted RNA binding protein YcfA (HicA-like mRNA interferase family)
MKPIKVKDLLKLLRQLGCEEVRQTGSHLIVRCGECAAVLVIHGKEVAPGTLRNIRDALEPCLGKGWIK